MDISIIILNYKQKGLVKQCVKGIVGSQPQLRYEIIVVDNNSADGTLEMVDGLFAPPPLPENQLVLPMPKSLDIPPIKAIAARDNRGFAVGNNLGIAQATGTYVMILNPDIAIVSGALEKMFSYMEQHQDVGMLGPRLINPDGTVQYSCRRFPNFLTPVFRRTIIGSLPAAKKPLGNYLMKDFDHVQTRDVDWLFGACLLIRRSVLNKVGLLDERFFMYFEDLDLCRRVWQAGFRVTYFVDVEMVHYHQRLSAERAGALGIFSRGGRIHIASGLKYFSKYRGVVLPVRNP